MNINIRKSDFLFLIAWIILLFADYFKYANAGICNILNILGVGLTVLDIVIHCHNLRFTETLMLISLIVLSIEIYRVANTRTPLMLTLTIFGVRKKNLKQLFQISFGMKLIQLVIALLCCPFLYYFRTGIKYRSVFVTPNGMGLIFFGLVISYIGMKIERKDTRMTIKEQILLYTLNFIILGYSGCKTVFLIVLFILLADMFANSALFGRFVIKAIPLLSIVFVIIMIRMALNAGTNAMELYDTVGSRWLLAKKYLDYYDITLFGNQVWDMGSFDFGYFALLIEQGLVYTIVFLLCFWRLFVRGIKENNKYLIVLTAAVLVFYTMERSAFNLVTNPLLLYFSAIFSDIGVKRRERHCTVDIIQSPAFGERGQFNG